jgi:divalent metal cation (Fe/Co/Zn/Cd) transporter
VTQSEDASVRTVVVAVAANLLVAMAKGVAAALTGSAAMLAETTHSIADTCNELLLYLGVRRGMRPADDRHPLGYGQARFFWSLLAAIGIFVIGGLLAIADGVQSLRRPEPVTNVPVGVAVLLVSAALVGLALALGALLLHLVTGSAVWDGAASLLIGLLLIGVAYILMRRNGALLIDEAAPAEVREELRQAVAQEP